MLRQRDAVLLFFLAAALFGLRIGAYLLALHRMYHDPPESDSLADHMTSVGLIAIGVENDLLFELDISDRINLGRWRFPALYALVALTSTFWAWVIRAALHLLGYW
jgi:hypothetical protein